MNNEFTALQIAICILMAILVCALVSGAESFLDYFMGV